MNCVNHPDVAAVAYCRECGKPLCGVCQIAAHGTVYCAEHAPAAAENAPGYAENPYTAPPPPPSAAANPYASPYAAPAHGASAAGAPSPGLAFLLGVIPGVGAIYNGQYAKGVVHVVILGLLFSIADAPGNDLTPLFVLLSILWFFYMAFEAYHTALKRLRGEPVDEFSSLFSLRARGSGTQLVGPVLIILLGVIFLLNTLGVLRLYEIIQFWPVLLIAIGAYMLWIRVTEARRVSAESMHSGTAQEAMHER
jgi:hypothetical protein